MKRTGITTVTTRRIILAGVVLVISATLGGSVWASQSTPTSADTASATPSPTVAPTWLSEDFISRLDGSTATLPLGAAALAALGLDTTQMTFNKTDEAYQNLIAGDKDLILVTAPSAGELQAAKDAGVELEVIPVVKDGLVFLANTANPVNNLTGEQIRQIYSGKITNWSAVGGLDAAIIPYQRQVNSGSQTLFLALAMGATKPTTAPSELRPAGMGELVDVISEYDNGPAAIGYSVFYYATEMYLKDNVKLLSVDGIPATAQTISDGTYPYVTNYFAVVRADTPASAEARQVVTWLLSPAGQKVASRANYVPLDAADIVANEPAIGPYGATVANTTWSSGTGGTTPADLGLIPADRIHCVADEDGKLVSLDIDGASAMSAGIETWYSRYADVPRETAWNNSDCDFIQARSGIATVAILGLSGWINGAVSSSGKIMVLSDFFYDSVNYIAFINRNLFDPVNNPESMWAPDQPADWTDDWPPGWRVIPNDYPYVAASVDYIGLSLGFVSPNGDPAFRTLTGGVGIAIPADLSPYGRIWHTAYRYDTKSGTNQRIPVITTTSTPSEGDRRLNAQIEAAAIGQPGDDCFTPEVWGDTISLIGFKGTPKACLGLFKAPPDVVGQWAMGTWEDRPWTVADLPTPWQTTYLREPNYPWWDLQGGMAIKCPVARTTDDTCSIIPENTTLQFGSQATVTAVWPTYNDQPVYNSVLAAVIVDGDTEYQLLYPLVT